jgi:outer membrane immunogenic protein
MKRSGIALLAFVALSTTAYSADLWTNNTSPVNSPAFSSASVAQWTGFYAGVSGGYGWGTTTNSTPVPGGTTSSDINSSGWTLGGHAGYNMDMGGFVLGGEADLQWANIGYSETVAAGTFTAKTDMFGTLRARAGVPIGQVMPFATLGVAYGRGSASIDTGGATTSQTANHFGWTAGVGIEAQATANLSIKAEYLYVDLGEQPYNNLGAGLGTRDIGQRFSTVRAGVSYKF